jgi:ABC-type hemin transport system substrate-binding protein
LGGEDFHASGKHPAAERVLMHAGMAADKKLQQLEALAAKASPSPPA